MSIPLKSIYLYGDGFNIEGSDLAKCLSDSQVWCNLCMPLDMPIKNKETLAEITLNNPYTLKETSITEYNEVNVNLAIMLIINYCESNKKNLLIHVHRGSSALRFIESCIDMIKKQYVKVMNIENNILNINDKILIKFMNGYNVNEFKNYPNYDVIFSLSLMGGLNLEYTSGILTLPSVFVPFDTTNRIIDCTKMTKCRNYLIEILDDILNIDQSKFFGAVNHKSENPDKQHVAQTLTKEMFKFTDVTVLQINELYNPKAWEFDLPVTIVE
jgi:hypothetical protein